MRRVLKQGIKGDDGEVTVEHGLGDSSNRIEIIWTCGGPYQFTPEDVKEAIHYIDDLASNPLWVKLKDSDKKAFQVRLENNKLYAENPNAGGKGDGGIPWNHLKDVLTEALQQGDQQGSPASP